MARRPHHRSIWEGTDRQSLAFHRARRDAADRVFLKFIDEMGHGSGPGQYTHEPALALKAREAADVIREYVTSANEECDE